MTQRLLIVTKQGHVAEYKVSDLFVIPTLEKDLVVQSEDGKKAARFAADTIALIECKPLEEPSK